jgi:TetR/AcrR family transcriptional regulator, regulator of cefoperazone and chloramphenicol sensitivity
MKQPTGDTRRRLIAAASELFAERGFRATTARDIAGRAGVNLAAGHYHYGSKKDLYLEVLREQFAQIWRTLRLRGGTRPPGELERLDRAELAELLRTRIRLMLDNLIGPPPGLHGTLMQREMTDPSQALPVIVEEFVQPMVEETQRIVARLEPKLTAKEVRQCVLSIVAQAAFYRFAMPAVLRLHDFTAYPSGFAGELAEHVATFSLGGIGRIGARRRRKGRVR